jgi:hypothetical protein
MVNPPGRGGFKISFDVAHKRFLSIGLDRWSASCLLLIGH